MSSQERANAVRFLQQQRQSPDEVQNENDRAADSSDSPPGSVSPPAQPIRAHTDPPPTLTVEDFSASSPTLRTVHPEPRIIRRAHTDHLTEHITEAQSVSRRSSRIDTWRHRKSKHAVEWKGNLDRFGNGRVLLIDYISHDRIPDGGRKIAAQEFSSLDGIKNFYQDSELATQAALRVIHVQNAPWATKFLLRKFNIDPNDTLVGTSFGRWAKFAKPQRRAGKPVLNGKSFRTQRDPWRGVSRTAFGLDYLKQYSIATPTPKDLEMRLMELNGYSSDEEPMYMHDSFVQRMSVYIQKKEDPDLVPMPDFPSPYNEEDYRDMQKLKKQYEADEAVLQENEDVHARYVPLLKTLDSGSTIIVFEQSASGKVEDTLIQARNEIESRWRRLTFYLSREDISTDDQLAIECTDLILKDIFKGLSASWESFLDLCETHISILEDKIYENPADESRAPELWKNSSNWLKVEKLLYIHMDVIKEMRHHLKDLVPEEEEEEWIESALDDFTKLENLIQEDLVKPTTNLSDLMYKSVEIRDSRQSLHLGASMWRLSWITFVFLPLTFLSGFFGMNVNVFEDNPSIKWYFIVAVPFMIVIMLGWYFTKHTVARNQQNPLRRGVYETLFDELAERHPDVWTRTGPREHLHIRGPINQLKWFLVSHWFAPHRTIASTAYDPANDELGMWSRTKHWLVRRWLRTMKTRPRLYASDVETGSTYADTTAMEELITMSQPVAVADGFPDAATIQAHPSRMKRDSHSDHGSRGSSSSAGAERPMSRHSAHSSGVIVEEKMSSDGEYDEEEGTSRVRASTSNRWARQGAERGSTAGLGVGERLSVPISPGRASEQNPEWQNA